MNTLLKSSLLVGFVMVTTASYAKYYANERNPDYAIFTADPQYPWTEKTDSGAEESSSEKEQRSRWLIENQYSDIVHFRNLHSQRTWDIPIMINGDITAYGHDWQRSYTREVQKKYFGSEFNYGLGNHDYENNDCFSESCAAGSITDFEEHHRDKVASFDLNIIRNPFFISLYKGSLAYSKDVGDVHLIQLNNEPTYSAKISSVWNPTSFEITDSLDWLENDLKAARAKNQIIILNMHKPDEWKGSPEQIAKFRKMIEDYKVTAVFTGHWHSAGEYVSWPKHEYFGDVPVFLSGSASQQTYLIAEFAKDRKTMIVTRVRDNHWPSRSEIATIPVLK